jgi:hypothetical protein
MYNYLFLNDEFAIMVCLLLVFSFLLIFLKKYIINFFFHIFDNVYFYFFVLLNINMHIYEYLLKKYIYISCAIGFNQVNLLLIFSNIILKKKIKENIVLKYIKKIKVLLVLTNIIFNVLKYLNNILLNVNITKEFNILKNSYIYINFYSLKNKVRNSINFIC